MIFMFFCKVKGGSTNTLPGGRFFRQHRDTVVFPHGNNTASEQLILIRFIIAQDAGTRHFIAPHHPQSGRNTLRNYRQDRGMLCCIFGLSFPSAAPRKPDRSVPCSTP